MRRKSSLDVAKQEDRIRRARKMTPEERLLACVNMSHVVLELARVGKRDRKRDAQPSRP